MDCSQWMDMARRRQEADDLERVERKLDRLTRLVVVLLFFQPVLLVGFLMPETTTQLFTVALLGLLAALLLFPNLETSLPVLMRRLGRTFGRLRRRFGFSPGR